MTSRKREGAVGDAWFGLLGRRLNDDLIRQTVNFCLESEEVATEIQDRYVAYTVPSGDLSIRTIFERDDVHENLKLITCFPYLPAKYLSTSFWPTAVDEWSNEVEAVVQGTVFKKKPFSFFCQNYLEYKALNIAHKKLRMNFGVIAKNVRVPNRLEQKIIASEGPLKGQTVGISKIRDLLSESEAEPERCEFAFQVQGIEGIRFMEEDLFEVKGVLFDENGGDFFFPLYLHRTHMECDFQIGQQLIGRGWLQAEIVDILGDL